jgi:hypothetical protein
MALCIQKLWKELYNENEICNSENTEVLNTVVEYLPEICHDTKLTTMGLMVLALVTH